MLALTPREVYQQLRDAALGIRPMTRLAPALSNNLVRVEIEGWQLLLDVEGKRLHHCERCQHCERCEHCAGSETSRSPALRATPHSTVFKETVAVPPAPTPDGGAR